MYCAFKKLKTFKELGYNDYIIVPYIAGESKLFLRKVKRIPLLGVSGSGKTYFLLSLGYMVSLYKWGEVSGDAAKYFNDLLQYVLRFEPIPSTMKTIEIQIDIRKIYIDGQERNARFVLSTKDFSGREFEIAMRIFKESFGEIPEDRVVKKFINLYRKSDGFIVIVDLVRDITDPEEFRRNKDRYIFNAFSEQISPLASGIELLIEYANVKGKPIFFVFTKSDVHNLSVDELSKYFDRIMAITIARLENRGVIIRKYATSAVGWGSGSNEDMLRALEVRGFGDILRDIVKYIVWR